MLLMRNFNRKSSQTLFSHWRLIVALGLIEHLQHTPAIIRDQDLGWLTMEGIFQIPLNNNTRTCETRKKTSLILRSPLAVISSFL